MQEKPSGDSSWAMRGVTALWWRYTWAAALRAEPVIRTVPLTVLDHLDARRQAERLQ
ncbi:hypothetical protein ABZV67_27745 [Streptomyces sp. NPDC005065]|uniref:hypothetical protein n=1 Tax=unclassified Streptomyces TaxID=2593676 RepID=UPI00339E3ED6